MRLEGVSIEAVFDVMKSQGARAKLVVVDASRRNPYERRFRSFSHGLAPIAAPDNALILSSATPGKVADDSSGEHSVLVGRTAHHLNKPGGNAEAVFNQTRIAIFRASEGEQVPAVSSSLLEDMRFDQRRAVFPFRSLFALISRLRGGWRASAGSPPRGKSSLHPHR